VTPFPPPPAEPPCPDFDGDGFTDITCGGTDCNDHDPNIHPGATEVCNDGIDNNCDGLIDCQDTATCGNAPNCAACSACSSNTDCTVAGTVCGIGTNTTFTCANGTCTATGQKVCGIDADGDGFLSGACGNDCNDANAAVNPGATEVCTGGVDDNCNGKVDCADAACTNDPACAASACAPCASDADCANNPNGTKCGIGVNTAFTCNTAGNCTANSGAQKVCGTDADGDGFLAPTCGADCNDADATIHPGALEIQCDGIDQDCSGADLCITGFSSSPTSVRFTALSNSSVNGVPETADPILLIACNGDQDFLASNNKGSSDFEVTQINTTTGDLEGWAIENNNGANLPGAGSFGHDALLYFSFVFDFPGVSSESIGTTPNDNPGIDNSASSRFPFDTGTCSVSTGTGCSENSDCPAPQTCTVPAAATVAKVLGKFQSASSGLTTPRAYFQFVRLNAQIFAIGGNNGAGATNIVDQHPQ
jgi:hypothetical protein